MAIAAVGATVMEHAKFATIFLAHNINVGCGPGTYLTKRLEWVIAKAVTCYNECSNGKFKNWLLQL